MASASDRMRLECGLDLQRRLPPNMIEKTVSNMIDLAPDLCEDLLEKIDQPLKMMKDELSG
jgi:capping protein beta